MNNLNINDWNVISEDQFKEMQFDSGVLVKSYDPQNPAIPTPETILCATTGDLTITCTPTLVDLGEDVNNLHGKLAELQYTDGWTCTIKFTALEINAELLKMALAAADYTVATKKVQPRNYLKAEDFQTIWWIGAKIGGGMVAVKLSNALNTAGMTLSTTKAGKGKLEVTLEAFSSISAANVVPTEFYLIPATAPSITLESYTLTLDDDDPAYTLRATTTPAGATITWTSGDTDVCTVTSAWNGVKITPVAHGKSAVTGSITVSGVTATATCLVDVVESTS